MKRKIALLLALVLLLPACGAVPEETAAEASTATTETASAPTAEPTTEAAAEPTSDPTEESITEPTTAPVPETTAERTEDNGQDYVLNTNTMKFHNPDCGSAGRIKDSNKETYHGTREELIAKGYSPCGNCHP